VSNALAMLHLAWLEGAKYPELTKCNIKVNSANNVVKHHPWHGMAWQGMWQVFYQLCMHLLLGGTIVICDKCSMNYVLSSW